jgi:membrane fusion protein, multidrug efflux system
MKTLTQLSLSLAIAIVLASCSSTSIDKKSQLEELKKNQKALTEQIKALEAELKSTDTSKIVIKTKEIVVKEVLPASFDYSVQTQGGVEAEENIMVSAKTPGIITQVYVKPGQSVSAGQVLAQIDNTLTLKGIEEVKGSLELATTVFERQKSLWDQKIGTEIQFLTAKNNKESLEKRLATMNEQNDMSKIKTQISGTVEDVLVKVGENTAPGMPAVRVIGTKNLKVVSNVSEAYISTIKVGNKANIEFLDLGKKFEGRVSFTGKNINPLSRAFTVEVAVPSGVEARPNMSCTVKIIFKTVPSALAVPINLVQTINNEKVVYVAEGNAGQWVARKRLVEVGGVYNNLAEIKSGLKPNDKVITVGYQGLNDGDAVSF